ncbi:hypothetical protein MCOR25_006063 [Pyricularia grisea]|uniref:SET domain-containing protein n=1 Tax=Pyricularia grisea TaxID=148305 RepID=A0A6P8B7A0_PYRGI|nr:hypothetical protein PgNI_05292 [Pyricularia grisea]KAI6362915.1 hypothetical protein MCOR25_006063 [Pyricularia grisea]TLD11123.1 hypothetical protein PgNI_05292 [Pyricularia grisea]
MALLKQLVTLGAALASTALATNNADKAAAAVEGILQQIPEYLSNITERALFHPKGWYDPKICTGNDDKWCLFSSRDVASGRGLAVISTPSNFQKIRRLEAIMNKMETKAAGPFRDDEVETGRISVVATEQVKRATKLMELPPVLMIHKTFLEDADKHTQEHMISAALSLLPEKTRALVEAAAGKSHLAAKSDTSNTSNSSSSSSRSMVAILRAHPLEASTGATHWDGPDHGRHLALYPEVLALAHDCRPNAAFYIDHTDLTLHLTAARKMHPGEELSISYINPRLGRAEREAAARRMWGRPCRCAACTGKGGDLKALAGADARATELAGIEAELKDADSAAVTEEMLRRYVRLMEEDGLQSRMADAYEQVAYNYGYLGVEDKARRFGNLAIQAATIEQGRESNDVTALRVFVNGVTEHYSWRWKIKRRGG